MAKKITIVFIAFLFSTTIAFCQPAGNLDSIKVVKHGASLVEVSKQFSFTEGPAVDKKGNIFFTDQPNDKIWKYDINGKLSLFMDKTGRSNGMYFDRNGNLITCADEKNQLWSVTPAKKVKILMTEYQGHHMNGPNDLWIDKYDGIFFTDPYYQRDYWERKKPEIEGQKVYYLPVGKKEAVVADDKLVQPNGIVGSADGKYLYVADIGDNKTYKYEITRDRKLINRKLFVNQGSDGMTLDNKGNLYLTGKGVTIYDAKGKLVGNIPVPA
ncbi:MAG: SMP-30/gluconolactonase/LRE family protein, partial [Bacteroidota bacterium]